MNSPLSDTDLDRLDSLGVPHRRSGERRMEAIVNNAWMRFLQLVLSVLVSGVALPMVGWGLVTVIDRLTLIDSKLFALQLANAESAIKLSTAQKDAADALEGVRMLRERVLSLEIKFGSTQPPRGTP